MARCTSVALLSLGLTLGACDETQRATYATYSAAETEGAVRRGWIPEYVPRSATDITEVHDLDLNTQRLRFRAPEADLRAMVAAFVPISLAEARSLAVWSPALSGDWPAELSVDGDGTRARPSLQFFRAPSGEPSARCLAIDWATGTVYAWSCSDRVT